MDDVSWGNQPPHDSYRSYGRPDATQPVPPMTGPAGPVGPVKHHNKVLRWAAGIAAAIVLAGGGAIVGLSLPGGRAPSRGQAALLSEALNGASSPAPVPSAAPGAQARRAAVALRHLRGLHGEFTVRARGSGFREIAFERGVIVAAGSSGVTVRAADGTTWVWTLVSDTVVRKGGTRSSAASLASGDPVFVGGPESGSVRDARLIIVPKKRAGRSSSQPGAAASPSAT